MSSRQRATWSMPSRSTMITSWRVAGWSSSSRIEGRGLDRGPGLGPGEFSSQAPIALKSKIKINLIQYITKLLVELWVSCRIIWYLVYVSGLAGVDRGPGLAPGPGTAPGPGIAPGLGTAGRGLRRRRSPAPGTGPVLRTDPDHDPGLRRRPRRKRGQGLGPDHDPNPGTTLEPINELIDLITVRRRLLERQYGWYRIRMTKVGSTVNSRETLDRST